MKNISTNKITPGMKIAKTIYNSNGNILISSGMVLKEKYIKRLKQLDIESIYIHPKGLPEVEAPDVISDQTRMDSVKTVNKVLTEIEAGEGIDNKEINQAVKGIIDEILLDNQKVIHLNDIRTFDDYVFFHSVNVTVLSLLIALESGYNEMQLKDIATGALLHDIGMVLVDKEIIKKKEKANQKEQEEFRNHAKYGYDILKENDEISIKAKHIAYQHHEKLDGTGYPRNLTGDKIIDYAQIVAVANIYDALTSDGNNFEKLTPNKALKIIENISGHKLNSDYVASLKNHVARYPIGTLVILNTKQVAMVIEVNQENLTKPVVKIVQDKSWRRVKDGRKIDLAKEDNIKIKEVKE